MIILCNKGRAVLKTENFKEFHLESRGVGDSGWRIVAKMMDFAFGFETIEEYEDYHLAEKALRGMFKAIEEKQETYEFPREGQTGVV